MSDFNGDNEDNPDVTAAQLSGIQNLGETLAGTAPILIFTAGDNEEADVVRATLAAAGIPTLLQSASVTTVMGAVDAVTRDTNNLGLYVMPSHAESARALLNAPPLSDEELAAQVDADPITLSQAEAQVKNA